MKQVALITGGGIGIGRATAHAFAKADYHVVVTDVLETEGKDVVEKIKHEHGSAEFHPLDVRSTERADAVVGAVLAAHGSIECIIANAGIAHKTKLTDLTDEK
jgi:3-oxoacyl-[acyl-carrier protein] reductase